MPPPSAPLFDCSWLNTKATDFKINILPLPYCLIARFLTHLGFYSYAAAGCLVSQLKSDRFRKKKQLAMGHTPFSPYMGVMILIFSDTPWPYIHGCDTHLQHAGTMHTIIVKCKMLLPAIWTS